MLYLTFQGGGEVPLPAEMHNSSFPGTQLHPLRMAIAFEVFHCLFCGFFSLQPQKDAVRRIPPIG